MLNADFEANECLYSVQMCWRANVPVVFRGANDLEVQLWDANAWDILQVAKHACTASHLHIAHRDIHLHIPAFAHLQIMIALSQWSSVLPVRAGIV